MCSDEIIKPAYAAGGAGGAGGGDGVGFPAAAAAAAASGTRGEVSFRVIPLGPEPSYCEHTRRLAATGETSTPYQNRQANVPSQPKYCYNCARSATFSCQGPFGGCITKADLCTECKTSSRCFDCRSPKARLKTILRTEMRCATCFDSLGDHAAVHCTDCDDSFCYSCTYSVSSNNDPFICIVCKGGNAFFEERITKALQICSATTEALARDSGPEAARDQKSVNKLQALLSQFCKMVDQLNRLVQYRVLEKIWPLLLRVVKFQRDNKLPCNLMTNQVVRFHVQPNKLHNELVQLVAQLNAAGNMVVAGSKSSAGQARSKKPTVAFAFNNVHGAHPIRQLTKTMLQLLDSEQLIAYIITIRPPNKNVPVIAKLHEAFSHKKRWIQLEAADNNSKKQALRKKVQSLKLTLLVDCIWPSADELAQLWKGVCRPGVEAQFIFLWPNEAMLSWDHSLFSGIVLDACMRIAVPVDNPQVDNVYCVSCWQPPVDCVEDIPRNTREPWKKNSGQKFRIHTPVDLTRISELCLEVLLKLLMELADAVVCYYGHPLPSIKATRRNMQVFAESNALDKDYFFSRVEWWGHRPTVAQGERMRNQVHVIVTFGSSSDHMGVNLALAAGVPVVTTRGSCGEGDVASWVAASMLTMMGLGALALPHGEEHQIVGLVGQFYEDGSLLMDVQSILDQHASEATSFFNTQRSAKDFMDLVTHLHSSNRTQDERNFISCPPEQDYFEYGEDCRLQRTAKAMVREANNRLQDDMAEYLEIGSFIASPLDHDDEDSQDSLRALHVVCDDYFVGAKLQRHMDLDSELQGVPQDGGETQTQGIQWPGVRRKQAGEKIETEFSGTGGELPFMIPLGLVTV